MKNDGILPRAFFIKLGARLLNLLPEKQQFLKEFPRRDIDQY